MICDTKGERALLATLLEQSIQTLKHKRYPELSYEVEFFFGASRFETYAHLLEIDPEVIREKVLEILEDRFAERRDPRILELISGAEAPR